MHSIYCNMPIKITDGKDNLSFRTITNTLPDSCVSICLASVLALQPAIAEEGGSGHYMPGSMSSFIDGVPGDPVFVVRGQIVTYDGTVAINRSIPIAGQAVANASAESVAVALTLLWAPEWDLGDKWSYAMTATIPWVDIKVSGDVMSAGGGPTLRIEDEAKAIGDIVLIPLMLKYKLSPDLSIDTRLAFYAPTGEYTVGALANTGKNFWTVEPTVGLMYFGLKNGREASIYFGADFNSKNDDTDYKSGTQVHIDATFAQHFPLWKGLAGAGLSAFYYKQVSGDSGSGATFGDFKARATGIGPALSFARKAGDADVVAEFKWLKEFNNKNRLEGDTLWFKIVGKF
jgi:hypothetical protein